MKLITISIFVVILSVVNCHHDDLATEWEAYKTGYNKIYELTEDALRMDIYRQNMNRIHEHNKLYEAGKVTFTMGSNQFTDLTLAEIRGSLMKDPNIRAEAEELNTKWELYKNEFGKYYEGIEDELRKELYRKNIELIEEHNKLYENGDSTFLMAVNQFSDRTSHEMILEAIN